MGTNSRIISDQEKQLMASGLLRPISRILTESTIHQFTSLDPNVVGGRPAASVFGKGSCLIITPNYKILCT